MSGETEKTSIGSYLAFPGIILSGQAVGKTVRAGGPIKAIQELRADTQGFKKLNETLKNSGVDTFTRGTVLKENYEALQKAAKQSKKLSKLSLKDKFLNLFRKEKVTVEAYKEAKSAVDASAAEVKTLLKGGKEAEVLASTVKASSAGAVKTIGKNILREVKNPFTLGITALFVLPDVISKVIPTFKSEGFGAGMKELGKTTVKFGGELASFAVGSTAGTAIGAAIGSIVPGIGNAVGGFIGSLVGMAIAGKATDKVVTKITGEDKEAQNQQAQEQTAEQTESQVLQQPQLNLEA